MKLAYFIAAHRLERQFEWLFRAVWNPDDVFVIHLSKSTPNECIREVHRMAEGYPNVHFLQPMQVTWGGWSLSEVQLEAMRLLCRMPVGWRYFINLSGQDYPVRPQQELRAFLTRHDGQNFLDVRSIDTQPFHIRRRLHWYCFEHKGRLRRLPIPNLRAMLSKTRWYGGYWAILSRDFCDWLVTTELTENYRRALLHTKSPDEFFLQTMIMRSPFVKTVNYNNRRYCRFETRAPSPNTLTKRDLNEIIDSRAFFARKFDERVDAEVLHEFADIIGALPPAAVLQNSTLQLSVS